MPKQQSPDLIKLCIRSCAIGFAAAAVFVGLMLAFDVVGLRGLVSGSAMGFGAVLMIWMLNGVVFAGVQFCLSILALSDNDDDDQGGTPMPVRLAEAIPVRSGDRRG